MCSLCFASFTKCGLRSAGYLLAGVFLVIASCTVSAAQIEVPVEVEVFTTSDRIVMGLRETGINDRLPGVEIRIYVLNEILRVEAELSADLPANPEQSKRIALQRIQHMGDQAKTKMQMAAQGLAKAMQYGVDRYPAIVFDGQVVVYGVTDVQTALMHYRTWRREGKR